MASISSAGIGSGLDVNNIVTQLVAAERGPADKRLSTATTKAQIQISALASLRSALANLQTASDALKAGGSSGLGSLIATSSKPELYTATASGKAVASNYNIEVISLAVASKRSSSQFASSAAVVGNGDVTLSAGGTSFTVSLADGANTLADLRDKINAATDNTGVGAAIIADGTGVRLLLTSRNTGTANALTVTSALFTTSEVQAAADAEVKFDGYSFISSSNQVSGAVDGITLNLLKAEPGTTTQLNVNLDQSASAAAVKAFVVAYNTVIKFIAQQTRFDATTRTAGPLIGDAATLGVSQSLRSIVGGTVSGAGTFSVLSQLGITTASDGTLSIDDTKLGTALTTNFTSVQKLFNGDTGIATRLSALTKTQLDDDGQIKAETEGLNARLKDISKQQDALDRRISDYERRTRAQFNNLDSVLSKLQSTSAFLTQQLEVLNKSSNN